MTPFPPSDQIQFLLDGEAWINQITINCSAVIFAFENGCRVEAGALVTYIDEKGRETVHDREWFDGQPITFHGLLEKPLKQVEANGLLLTLTFADGRQLVVHSDLQRSEAGAVLGPNDSRLGFYF
ncbi:hypothetical protein [Brevundimonas sp. LjRoot202]|uniref:hypothetical protein n=1 Tax=Brevundimonas sp. LjRoot202 TaxID=3342281 RepID=UPI003ED09DE0